MDLLSFEAAHQPVLENHIAHCLLRHVVFNENKSAQWLCLVHTKIESLVEIEMM
jgi:hypothetical protein